MARPNIEDLLERWLRAEETGNDRFAELSLVAVLRSLPGTSPGRGFARAVLARLETARVREPRSQRRLAPAALVGSLAMSVAILALPSTLKLLGIYSSASWLAFPAKALVGMVSWMSELFRIADLVLNLFEASLLVASSLPVVLTLVVLTSVAALAFRALTSLLIVDRSSCHASA